MQVNVIAVKTTQAAIPELGRESKDMYFLKLINENGETTLNVGEKTYNTIKKMEKPKEKVTSVDKIK